MEFGGRKLSSILGNSQKLDGGAMFGNAPKGLWTRWVDVDEKNRIDLACRALLVEQQEPEFEGEGGEGRKILFETGIGCFFEPKLRERYGVNEEEHVLLRSLSEHGASHEEIDVVVLSHLHFDHAGGLLAPYQAGEKPRLLFPRATFVVGEAAWKRAKAPHFRDRASFIPELSVLLEESGRLEIITGNTSGTLGPGYRFHFSDGHTPGLMLTEIAMPDGPVVFAGDLVPGTPWVHLPITMGYDRFPELLIEEKQTLFEDLLSRQGRLFYTHDPKVALSSITKDERGRFLATDKVESLLRATD